MFKQSKLLSATENRELEIFDKLLYAAPLPDSDYTKYVELCKKAHRKPHQNW